MRWLLAGALLFVTAGARPSFHVNVYPEGVAFELRVFVSASPRTFTAFNDTHALIWHAKDFEYTADFSLRAHTAHVPLTDALLANGTLFAHIYVTKVGASPDPKHGSYVRDATTSTVMPLVTFGERLEAKGLYNLISGEAAPWEVELRRGAAEAAAAGRPAGEFISYWKPMLHAQLLIDTEPHPHGEMPPLLWHSLQNHRLISGRHYEKYLPLIYVNELTVMKQHWMAVNSSLPGGSLPLELSFSPLPSRRFQWMVNLQHSFKQNEETLGISERESEDLRGMFVHTNPVLLYTTVAVSGVHLLFDVLAFKNDVSFWSSVDTMEGLSSRSLILNQGMEAIILLYLFEEDASWLVKVTSLLSLVLGFFKIFKSLSVKRSDKAKREGAGGSADEESLTDQTDRLAFRYLSGPLLLLVVGYSGHSLVTGYHRGWYAWLIESLVALVYGGGFIVMTPQLFINYKLKSVAHLNWKFFMYKALNTFIDDLFAFIIKMPTLHRMSCFRDDIVFAVFLYQRWVYRVDMSRVNEFGHRGEGEGEGPAEGPVAGASGAGAPDGDAKKKKKLKKTQ